MALTHIDGLLLDMDGVLAMSWRPLPGAAAAVTRLHAAGLPLRVLTNTTALSRARFGAALREAGFPFADDDILTASVATGAWLREQRPGARVFHLGDAQPDDLEGVDLVGLEDEPEVVLSPAPTSRSPSRRSIACSPCCAVARSSSPCTATSPG